MTDRDRLLHHLAHTHGLDPSTDDVEQHLLTAATHACAKECVGVITALFTIAEELSSYDDPRFRHLRSVLQRFIDDFQPHLPNIVLFSIESLFHSSVRELLVFNPELNEHRDHLDALLARVDDLVDPLSRAMYCARSYVTAAESHSKLGPGSLSDRSLLAAALRAAPDLATACQDPLNGLLDTVTVPALNSTDPGLLDVIAAAFALPPGLLAQLGEVALSEAVSALKNAMPAPSQP